MLTCNGELHWGDGRSSYGCPGVGMMRVIYCSMLSRCPGGFLVFIPISTPSPVITFIIPWLDRNIETIIVTESHSCSDTCQRKSAISFFERPDEAPQWQEPQAAAPRHATPIPHQSRWRNPTSNATLNRYKVSMASSSERLPFQRLRDIIVFFSPLADAELRTGEKGSMLVGSSLDLQLETTEMFSLRTLVPGFLLTPAGPEDASLSHRPRSYDKMRQALRSHAPLATISSLEQYNPSVTGVNTCKTTSDGDVKKRRSFLHAEFICGARPLSTIGIQPFYR
ncbi:hypothetical protein GMOD_00000063 [Pyrenophora seminiperda CCB06]|uniref:Uncharacterized protein n=1 Tax=Pyrenophora seminiperda CCB06 TaxID=1302712 RepID=A0A3M7M6K5_9PLEO|nr:hypothetical protein GMOD_00000063 [Pyrenophora seminiperda CCB06]